MNYKVLLLLTLLATSSLLNAQIKREKIVYEDDKATTTLERNLDFTPSIYVLVGIGGNIGLSGSTNNIYFDPYTESSKESFGNSFSTKLGIGHPINKNLSIECNFDINIGINNTNTATSYSGYDSVNSVYFTETPVYKFSGDLYKITPLLVWSFNVENKVKPYIKAGAILGFSNRYEIHEYTDEYPNSNYLPDVLVFKYKDTGGKGIGLALTLGIKKEILDNKFYWFGEITYQQLNQTYEKGSMISATINDQDLLNRISIYDKEYTYNSNPKNTGNPNVKSEREIEKYNFDSIGLKIGLIYMLN